MRVRRTKQGIILEKILHNNKHRYLFCWEGETGNESYDCACCITYVGGDDAEFHTCGCVCHERIETMANAPHMRLFLLALEAMDELPFYPKDFNDWFQHAYANKREHDQYRVEHPRIDWACECDDCKFIRDMEAKSLKCAQPCDCHVCEAFASVAPEDEVEDPEVAMSISPVPTVADTVFETSTEGYKLGDIVEQNGVPIGVCVAAGTVATHDHIEPEVMGDSCTSCGGSGLGDYPYECHDCNGTGKKQ